MVLATLGAIFERTDRRDNLHVLDFICIITGSLWAAALTEGGNELSRGHACRTNVSLFRLGRFVYLLTRSFRVL